MNLLFICSRNQWRSPTAEAIFRNHPLIRARSAGTASAARRRVNALLLHWADLIFVMEHKHRQRLQQQFADQLRGKQIIVLGIPDRYQFRDPELVELLKAGIHPYLSPLLDTHFYRERTPGADPEERHND